MRGIVPQDNPLPSLSASPTTTSTAVLFPMDSRESSRRSFGHAALPEIPVRRLSPVQLRDLPSYGRDEVSATTLGTGNYDGVVENAQQVRLERSEPVRELRHSGRKLEQLGGDAGVEMER